MNSSDHLLPRLLAGLLILGMSAAMPVKADDDQLASDVRRLVAQLDEDRAAVRDQAEQQLLELAGDGATRIERLLERLPKVNDQMPLAVQERLRRIRRELERRVAQAVVAATHLTLQGDAISLTDAFAAIGEQTGNRIVDNREQFGQDATSVALSLDLKDEPFWSAIDQILDQVGLGVYNFAGQDALALVAREPGAAPRFGRACYRGPFRFEVLEVQAQRDLRHLQRQSLKLRLEIAWEPRLRPIALSLPLADVVVIADNGDKLQPLNPEAVLNVEVQDGSQVSELIVPLTPAPRSVEKIASLKGRLSALVPGQRATFRFDDLTNAAGQTQRRGGVQVALDGVKKNNLIWEVHMRLRLDEPNDALASHRGWAFQNLSYLAGKDGEPIENAGFETTLQTSNEIGFAYFFDPSEPIDGLTWVYESPAAIIRLPVDFQLNDVELP